MERLIALHSNKDIPKAYHSTPIEKLVEYHNFHHDFETYDNADLLIGMCMDNRKQLHIPQNFSFIIRTGGANLKYSEFYISFALSIGKVNHLALIGHNHCGMVNLPSKKDDIIKSLTEDQGWSPFEAEKHYAEFAPKFEV